MLSRQRLWWAVFGVIGTVTSVLLMRRPVADRLADLHVYWGAVRAVQSGQPLYEFATETNDAPFTYPPFALIVFWPLGWLREGVVQVGFLVLICLALAAIAAAIAPRRELAAIVACGLIITAPAQSNLRFGQVSALLVLLVLVDVLGVIPQRYRGILVGVAAAIKLTPLLFIVFFLVSRRYRDAARAAGAFAACALVGAVALPAESWHYWTHAVFATSRIGELASQGNQSVHGVLLRAGVAPDVLPVLWGALIAVICAAGLWRARVLQLAGEPGKAAVIVGCTTVAVSPVSWTHHQIWPVLAAIILISSRGAARKAAGALLLIVMTASLGVLLKDVSMTPGLQFVLENARALGTVIVCLAGFGALAATTATTAEAEKPPWRVLAASVAALAVFALLPLPAQADPTFKAYSGAELDNPRYFFLCGNETECARLSTAPLAYAFARESSQSRMSGLVSAEVDRLEFKSAPGGPPRAVPLVERYPGRRAFALRAASLTNGSLIAYDATGQVLATVTGRGGAPISPVFLRV